MDQFFYFPLFFICTHIFPLFFNFFEFFILYYVLLVFWLFIYIIFLKKTLFWRKNIGSFKDYIFLFYWAGTPYTRHNPQRWIKNKFDTQHLPQLFTGDHECGWSRQLVEGARSVVSAVALFQTISFPSRWVIEMQVKSARISNKHGLCIRWRFPLEPWVKPEAWFGWKKIWGFDLRGFLANLGGGLSGTPPKVPTPLPGLLNLVINPLESKKNPSLVFCAGKFLFLCLFYFLLKK